jgi:IclR family mhp operon transcriptional activator
MLVRETTHRFSPLSFHRAMIRQRMPVLFTSAGRAYLAYCSDEERQQVLGLLVAGNDDQANFARNRVLVEQMLERVRRQGYSSNEGEWNQQVKIAAIAMPVRHKGNVLASINVVFLKKAMQIAEAAERYLPALRAAVEKIEDGLNESGVPLPIKEAETPPAPAGRAAAKARVTKT